MLGVYLWRCFHTSSVGALELWPWMEVTLYQQYKPARDVFDISAAYIITANNKRKMSLCCCCLPRCLEG
jgi:hypothetical protein